MQVNLALRNSSLSDLDQSSVAQVDDDPGEPKAEQLKVVWHINDMKVIKTSVNLPILVMTWRQQRDLNWTELNCVSLTQDWAALCSLALNKTGNAATCLTSHPWQGSWQRHYGIYVETSGSVSSLILTLIFLSLRWTVVAECGTRV